MIQNFSARELWTTASVVRSKTKEMTEKLDCKCYYVLALANVKKCAELKVTNKKLEFKW